MLDEVISIEIVMSHSELYDNDPKIILKYLLSGEKLLLNEEFFISSILISIFSLLRTQSILLMQCVRDFNGLPYDNMNISSKTMHNRFYTIIYFL